METNLISSLDQIDDDELLARVKQLLRREREATVVLIAHLAVLDGRRLYLAEGSASMFTYCTQVLHLSESAAYRRIEAARTARRFPVVLAMLAEGTLNLTSVVLLSPVLTPENHLALLAEARHQSKERVLELRARVRPRPDVPACVRKLPTPRGAETTARAAEPAPRAAESATRAAESATAAEPAGPSDVATGPEVAPKLVPDPEPRTPASILPLAPERYRIQFTASAETRAKLRQVQDLLKHRIPDGDIAQVMDVALTVLLRHLEKTKFAATERPREARGVRPGSRHIPAAVKRAVLARDGRRCAFVGRDGSRCTETGCLEFHHVEPHADGGPPTVENVEVRCRRHNGYEAAVFFGAHEATELELPL